MTGLDPTANKSSEWKQGLHLESQTYASFMLSIRYVCMQNRCFASESVKISHLAWTS